MELENDIKQIRQNATSEKELSMKMLGELKAQLNVYRAKSSQWETETQKTGQDLEKVKLSAEATIKKLEEKLRIRNQRLS